MTAEPASEVGTLLGALPQGAAVTAAIVVMLILLREMRAQRLECAASMERFAQQIGEALKENTAVLREVVETNHAIKLMLTTLCERLGRS